MAANPFFDEVLAVASLQSPDDAHVARQLLTALSRRAVHPAIPMLTVPRRDQSPVRRVSSVRASNARLSRPCRGCLLLVVHLAPRANLRVG
jgi:hypothetical protein